MIEDSILKGRIEIDATLSKDAKLAIKNMMTPDQNKRPTAKEILEFNFFKSRFSNI